MKWIVQTDGGSPANPGPASFAFVIKDNDVTVFKRSGYLPHATNNEAEYKAVIAACVFMLLEFKEEQLPQEIEFWCDSELVVKQIKGQYKVHNEGLRPHYEDAMRYLKLLRAKAQAKVTMNWFKRDNNKEADELCNQVLERHGYVFANKKRG